MQKCDNSPHLTSSQTTSFLQEILHVNSIITILLLSEWQKYFFNCKIARFKSSSNLLRWKLLIQVLLFVTFQNLNLAKSFISAQTQDYSFKLAISTNAPFFKNWRRFFFTIKFCQVIFQKKVGKMKKTPALSASSFCPNRLSRTSTVSRVSSAHRACFIINIVSSSTCPVTGMRLSCWNCMRPFRKNHSSAPG